MPHDHHTLLQVVGPVLFNKIDAHYSGDPDGLDREVKFLFNQFWLATDKRLRDLDDRKEHAQLIPTESVTRKKLTAKYGTPPSLDVPHNNIHVEINNIPTSPTYHGLYDTFHELIVTTNSVCICIGVSNEKTLIFTFETPPWRAAIPTVTLGFPFDDDFPRDREVKYETVQDAIATVLKWSNITEVNTLCKAVDALFLAPPSKRLRKAP